MWTLTAENITRRVLSAIDVGGNSSGEISNTNVESHAYAALVLSRNIISKPNPQFINVSISSPCACETHQQITPGSAEYAPITQK